MLETYINEFIHLYCSSFLKITETEPNHNSAVVKTGLHTTTHKTSNTQTACHLKFFLHVFLSQATVHNHVGTALDVVWNIFAFGFLRILLWL
jgi:hypothetical protein